MIQLRHGSLFSGIGGFDLAASWLGWQNIFQVEIDPFCRIILKHHFPYTDIYTDIKSFNARQYHKTIDIISGGFPCQPFSIAGQRLGSADDRYLWPQMLRVIDEIRPTWVVGENVAGILSMVQPGVQINLGTQATLSQEGSAIITEHQFIIESICQDFERIGYTVQPLLIPACSIGAPHRRNRIWFIAHAGNNGLHFPKDGQSHNKGTDNNKTGQKTIIESSRCGNQAAGKIITDTNSARLERTAGQIIQGRDRQFTGIDQIPAWSNWPTQSAVCLRDDGLSDTLVNITFPKWRKQTIHALGNAIVPQVAFQIFAGINAIETENNFNY